MSILNLIFGKKCSRCNSKRSRNFYNRQRVCKRCLPYLKAEVKAEEEQPRICPVDNINMDKKVVKTVVVDICPKCGGIWFDKVEFDEIKKMTKSGIKSETILETILCLTQIIVECSKEFNNPE